MRNINHNNGATATMNPLKLEFWAKNNFNVLFEGSHGVGKTASVKEAFNKVFGEQGKDWLYFSAATMDAWVDFVGVPREVIDEEDGQRYLELVRPRQLAKDTVKAIFFDEYNRAPAKVRNATMELLQFKSINGKKFENLRVIWGAINPDGDENYDTERLDPAQKDRFDVHVKVPYDVSRNYFWEKYGKSGEEACLWWKEQDEDVRLAISPRRLETAIRMYLSDGDPSDVLPAEANIQEFIVRINDGSFIKDLMYYYSIKDTDKAKESLINENFYYGVEHEIINTNKHGTSLIEFFVPLMPNEKIAKLVSTNQKVRDWFTTNVNYSDYSHVFDPIIRSNDTNEQRAANNMQTSTISRLKMWKKNSGGDDKLSDAEYINMIADPTININFFKNEEEQTNTLHRLIRIIDKNPTMEKVDYLKMLGPIVELYRTEKFKEGTRHMLTSLATILEKNFGESLYDVLTDKLPGLRQGRNPGIFQAAKTSMINEGIISEPSTVQA